MRNLIVLACGITSASFGQKVISEISYKEEKQPLEYVYLPNQDKVVLIQGKPVNKIYKNEIQDIWSFDKDGFTQKLISNEKLTNCVFSPIETAFLIGKISDKNEFPKEYKLNLDGSSSNFFKINENFRYFNDIYGLSIVNQKNNDKVDLKNDELFLKVVDLFSGQSTQNKLVKPDLNKIENKTTTVYSEGVNFDVRINEDNISFITKSINKNYKSATIYRSLYNLNGTKIGDFSYLIDVPKYYLLFADNGGGTILDAKANKKLSELAINNYLVDKDTGNVYVFGIFGNEPKELGESINIPLGVYVFKFDAKGKLIWESVQEIIDITGFNQKQDISKINLSLRVRKDEVLCTVNSKELNYSDVIVIQNDTGQKKSDQLLKFTSDESVVYEYGIKSNLIIDQFKQFRIDKETLYFLNTSDSLQKYFNSLDKTKSLFFKSYISKKGFWLIETDNASYSRVLFFS
ncbi:MULTISPECIES: hypothetical protein [Flavobacterium]|uniref:Uncharacterized protein n=2 Tax=Flavobacterium covae TaxID=2906076 RepID=A0ABW8PJF3_9FLAO|nr:MULTISPECIES: hypothetical protein [Flavobacterium]AMA49153.1 hypothetical protein AWN65_06605 [Flavobacterium covae]AND64776.1 hypothetical protein AX766_10430 [Flavobacterium covae]MCJ1810544.1 hypothetical protein [Flavobacterium covae]OWP81024.1 hypothetical protein BWK63_07905 [Flavobacterium covae]POR22052.1 hypothetical protein BWK57_07625 [Flavobacterium columnare]